MLRVTATIVTLLCFEQPLAAEIVRIEVQRQEDVLAGLEFGLAGSYEKLIGLVYFAVDPSNPANQIITDIDNAPRNSEGRVEFHSEFYLLKPKNMGRASGALLFEVGNRGNKGLLSFFNRTGGNHNPVSKANFGDGFLLHEGFTLLWLGWQWDTPDVEGRMRMYVPYASKDGEPIRGLVRSDFVPLQHETDHSLADRGHIAYPVADTTAPGTQMTVRDAVEAPRTIISRSKWGFGRVENGTVVPDTGRVYLNGGFEPQKIYEDVYTSENPPLVGLGPTGIRDLISHLKNNGDRVLSIPKASINRALAFGISQSGRFLRSFLFYGFNKDESHRRVFDGVISHVAGGGRGSFNHRFAQASRDAHPFLNMFYPTDIFPFTDVAQTDPETGLTAGLLQADLPQFLPKVFYTNSSYEYWGRAASLIHTSIDGKKDAPLLENVRIYQFSGTQHGPTHFPPQQISGQQVSNPMDFRWAMRALLVAMDGWTSKGITPPVSQYGRIDSNTLVPAEELSFPTIPGVTTSARVHKAYRSNYGATFATQGIVTIDPPISGKDFPILVPAIDKDGNELVGISMPEHTVPLATYTGWNPFNTKSGPSKELSSMQGMFLPFPRTKAERETSGDPRLSIEERYESRTQYLGLIATAGLELIEDGYLLDQDLPALVREAGEHWDYIMETNIRN